MKYVLIPLESFTNKGEVQESVKMLARGELDQPSAQALAWQYASGLTWEELTQKIKAKHLDGSVEMYFTPDQISLAKRSAVEAHRRAEVASKNGDYPSRSK